MAHCQDLRQAATRPRSPPLSWRSGRRYNFQHVSQVPAHHEVIDPEPAWDMARLFPPQGQWSEFEYLCLTDSTNQLVELVGGRLEVLPVPTFEHQLIVMHLHRILYEFVTERDLGWALFAALRVHIRDDTFREPDVLYMSKENRSRARNRYWEGADLVMEVVSDDETSHGRDWDEKRRDYAAAGISEYWIVDPQLKKILVLRLDNGDYVTHGEAGETGQVRSALLEGFAVDAAAVWAAADF